MSVEPQTEFIVTIDGPAGAGKSSVARLLAEHFGCDFLDTGAMYRTITLACLKANIELSDQQQVIEIAKNTEIAFKDKSVYADGTDVTQDIRTPEVNSHIRFIADSREVREILGALQVQYARGKRMVTEGRDQGTEVFPDAACKIFLTAKPDTRARRRHQELIDRGAEITFEEVLAAQEKRDQEDAERPVGALRPAKDAAIVYTDDLSQEEVVERLAEIVNAKLLHYSQSE